MISTFLYREYNLLDSTQLEAKRLLDLASIHPNTVIITKRQTQGRGRYQRIWKDNAGDATFTMVLKPEVNTKILPQLGYIAALAVGNAINEYISNHNIISYKWPNDILLDRKKISGILLELLNNSVVLIGIGVNIVHKEFEDENLIINSFESLGINVKKNELIYSITNHFINFYNDWIRYGFNNIRKLWLQNAESLNQEITVKFCDHSIIGIFKSLDDNGNLMIQRGQNLEIINAGDIL